ncbi:HupE/UreJ family protein [Aquimarina sp. AD10]|uniref:HupE / UreJ protein n=1 Tax=Aquimarina aggregata TaxID=1642818 RepID=A0A162YZ00_9FLAO|nr:MULTISPECIES: HupE/UreJ family protein [Aquimarina]AXT61355.1 HupE/UreJ family protein [Aquimarina sp. AD10]KZS39448.1 HupE / UreJ protein [Aquimarina aggregata]RKN01451.1 HupE/UreJ family protein [Aquimarina sp. AD10]
MSEFWLYVKLGFSHVLDWNAYDHILFLIVLTVGYTFDQWKKVLILVTIFTLGHTISLILGTYNVVSVNSRLVEFLIPVTILVTAIFNVLSSKGGSRNGKMGILYATTLFFGLIHGLGFSSYFKAISSNVSSKILPLIEFALGVELSQIVVVFIVIFISFIMQTFFRFSKRDWILVISSVVIGMVIPMLIANKIW